MIATLLLLSDLSGSLALSDRTEARARAPGTTVAAASLDLETAPTIEVTLASRRLRGSLSYTPRLTLWDAGSARARPTLLHGASGRVEWRSQHARVSLDEAGSYGFMNLAALALAPGLDGALPRAQLVPTPRLVESASTMTTLASRLTLPRWSLDMIVGYAASGGVDAGARAALPFQAGPFSSFTADHSLSRRDHLTTTLAASVATFSSGPESILAEIGESFRHLLSRAAEARISLGVSQAWMRTSETSAHRHGTYPVAEVGFDYRPTADGQVGLRAAVRLGPVVNRLIGYVDERLEGSLAAVHVHRRLATRLLVSGSQSVPVSAAGATRVLAGEAGAAYDLGRVVMFDAGVRALWQRQEMGGASFVQGTLFVGVTFRAPPIRL